MPNLKTFQRKSTKLCATSINSADEILPRCALNLIKKEFFKWIIHEGRMRSSNFHSPLKGAITSTSFMIYEWSDVNLIA